jgi:hypothetical protein
VSEYDGSYCSLPPLSTLQSHLVIAQYFYDKQILPYAINGVTEWHIKIQYFTTPLKCDGNLSQSEVL